LTLGRAVVTLVCGLVDLSSPRALSLLAIGTLLFCAICVNFSWVQSWNNSDSVIPALISIEKYSPFYWSENRFGMLVPLLASPLKNYGWNLLLQSQLIVLAGVGTLVLLDRFTADDANDRGLRLPLTALLLLLFYKPVSCIVLLLPGSPYLVSLFLLLASFYFLLAAQRIGARHFALGGALVCLALWVNVSNVVMAVGSIAAWPRSSAMDLRRRAGALAIIVGTALAVLRISDYFPGTDFRQILPVFQWPQGVRLLLANMKIGMRETAAAATISGAVIFEALRFRSRPYSPGHALAFGAVCQIVVTGGSTWVAQNAHDARYIAGPIFILLGIALLTLTGPVAAGLRRAAGPAAAASVCCLIAVVVITRSFGFPSPDAALGHIHTAMSDGPAPPGEMSCTHLIGSYWFVWEKVFDDRLRTGERRLWPVTHRSDAIREYWTAVPANQRKYCGLCSDPQIEEMRTREGVGPLTKEEVIGGVCAFREIAK
jgi:hypothetical protein